MENIIINFISFYFRPILSLLVLLGILVYFLSKKKFPSQKFLFYCLVIFSLILIFRSFLLSFLNWYFWSQKETTRYLLPPYNPISYVLKYSWYHYFFEVIITLVFGWLVFFFIKLFNNKFEGSLFYEEEKYLAALGILATGWPNCLIYLFLVLFLGVFFHLIRIVFNSLARAPFRLSLLYFWLPCSLIVLFLSGIINQYIGITQLNI